MGLRITTWNVNGIRNPFAYQPWRDKRTFEAMFDILEADIVVMQELKIQRKDLMDDMVLVPGWDCYYSLPRHKKGYSGVGIYTRNSKCSPIRAEEGVLGVLRPPKQTTPYFQLPEDEHIGGYLTKEQLEIVAVDPAELDAEGRCVVLEFPAFVLFGIYSPANTSGTRDDFRYGFLNALDMRVRNLIALGKRVVVTGDLNVSRAMIDTANAAEMMRKEGITRDEYLSSPNRRIFNQLISGAEVVGERDKGREHPVMWDICRGFHPWRTGMYTHWDQKINARPGNFGSRIDFVLCSLDMKRWFCKSNIQEGLLGSDHCPVYAVIKDQVTIGDDHTHIEDIMNPHGMFKDGERMEAYSSKPCPAFSAKLLPEFTNRRSIKDMFKPSPKKQESDLSNGTTSSLVTTTSDCGTNGNAIKADLAAENSSPTKLASTLLVKPTQSPEDERSTPDTGVDDQASRKKKRKKPPRSHYSKRKRPAISASASSDKVEESVTDMPISEDSVTTAKDNSLERTVSGGDGASVSEPSLSTSSQPNTTVTAITSDNPSQSQRSETAPGASAISGPLAVMPDELDAEEVVVDQVAAKEAWAKIFKPKPVPLCESHSEPMKRMKTRKKGFNCGREFWMCVRPLGPSGNSERNTQWRCPTFKWTSDWNGELLYGT